MSQPSEDQVLDALRPIEDPDFKRSIVDLGFIKNLSIDGGKVSFAIELTTPACPVKEKFQLAAEQAVGALAGVSEVEVTMTAQTRGSTHDNRPEGLENVKNVIAVASGKGGVGKTAATVNLAAALTNAGQRVGVFDADLHGPSVPKMLGIKKEAKLDDERPTIASVIVNRLDSGIALQIDATIIYALGVNPGEVTLADLEVDSPFNTYLYPGLPPAPIGGVRSASIAAAAAPEETDFYYYVLVDSDGTHGFSETLEEHNQKKADAKEAGVLTP